ncbi:MAG: hypothetical protein R2724_30955 [Bryobacterales bacterium]
MAPDCSSSQVIWNDREDGQYVSRVVDIESGKSRTLPLPVRLSPTPSGPSPRSAAQHTRPGYALRRDPRPECGRLTPDDVGIWKMDP